MEKALILENGSVFYGTGKDVRKSPVFQLIFNTSMVGYQELLTDPCCYGLGVVMTYPLIGNYGTNKADAESNSPKASALIVRKLAERGSNFRSEAELRDVLDSCSVDYIEGVDTRQLTKVLRSGGSMRAMLVGGEFDVDAALAEIKAYNGGGEVKAVSAKEKKQIKGSGKKLAVIDLGEKNSMIAAFTDRDCDITVFPYDVKADEILQGGFDGAFISCGPGNPEDCDGVISEVKKLLESGMPMFGVGLGHQLMAMSAGAKSYALPNGHHGGNHPVRCFADGRVRITAQNHLYAVSADGLNGQVTHENVNDHSVEGISYSDKAFSVQYHPSSKAGPADKESEYDKFLAIMGGVENA